MNTDTPPASPHWSQSAPSPTPPTQPLASGAVASSARSRTVIPYENFWTLRSAAELALAGVVASFVLDRAAFLATSLAPFLLALVLTRRVIVIDRTKGTLQFSRVFAGGPGPTIPLANATPFAREGVRKARMRSRGRIVGERLARYTEVVLGQGAPTLEPAMKSYALELADVLGVALGRRATDAVNRQLLRYRVRAFIRAALTTGAAVGLSFAAVEATIREDAPAFAYVLGAGSWLLAGLRWRHVVSAVSAPVLAEKIAVALGVVASVASVAGAVSTHVRYASERRAAELLQQRSLAEDQRRLDAIPAQRETPPAIPSPASLGAAIDAARAERSLTSAGFTVTASRHPFAADWTLSARGRVVTLDVDAYSTAEHPLRTRRILPGYWLQLDARDPHRAALLQSLSASPTLDRQSIEAILRSNRNTRVMPGGDDPFTVRAWRGDELIAVTAIPFEQRSPSLRRCLSSATQVLCVSSFRADVDPAWLPWALATITGAEAAPSR
ncbi:MAG: hypothetical protein JNK05_28160 [Myxococcales bacterium]|nr:hypothetical protein [Myxococcales bacterium]